MKPLIIANWKMNPSSQKEARELFNSVRKNIKDVRNVDVVICPPFVYLENLNGLTLGAQNIFYKEKGAFTGEISALQLKDLNVEYVIIGHSERRKYFGETDETVNKKIKTALEAGLKIIFCIGENDGEDKTVVFEKQIEGGSKGVLRGDLKNIIIAYEPVWAIGTGKNCSIDQTLSSVLLIRKIISKWYNRDLAHDMKILYGGSVNSTNSAEYLKNGGVNGLLVGGASLKAEEFIAIIKSTYGG